MSSWLFELLYRTVYILTSEKIRLHEREVRDDKSILGQNRSSELYNHRNPRLIKLISVWKL